MPKLLALVSGLLLVVFGGAAVVSLQHVYQQQHEFDSSLIAQGIVPSLQGVEAYITRSAQPGISKSELLKRLAVIGVVGHSGVDLPVCEEIRVFLLRLPGNTLPFLPSTPPMYL